jgi:hypothetical protein
MGKLLRRQSFSSGRGLTYLALTLLGLMLLLNAVFAPLPTAQALDLDNNMVTTWERTDLLVSNGTINRSWMWGPRAFFVAQEDYANSPGGKRLVAYFDKSRMEINNPNGDRNTRWFVTNGLLVKEMISGQMATGDSKATKFLPAGIRVVGDQNNNPEVPTYAGLYNLASFSANATNRSDVRSNQFVNQTVDARGNTGVDFSLNRYNVKYTYYDNTLGHNVPDVFWQFMNSEGPVWDNGRVTNGPVVDWLFSTGLPLTEAFWTRARISGVEKYVLMQAFERRVLTYNPDNDPAWRVEMGNVGEHYRKWRYTDNAEPRCNTVPIRGFGTLWGNDLGVRVRMGCPIYYAQEQVTKISVLNFQNGKMLFVDSTKSGNYSPPNNYRKAIYILFNDTSYIVLPDTWNESLPETANLTPPAPNLYEPKRGFGKVWRESTSLRLQERLGWATEPNQRDGDGAVQDFNGGTMHWTSVDTQIFTLFRYYQGLLYAWEVYPDNWKG